MEVGGDALRTVGVVPPGRRSRSTNAEFLDEEVRQGDVPDAGDLLAGRPTVFLASHRLEPDINVMD
jgi:hypothetical protein